MRIITKSSYLIGLTSCLFAGPVMATVIFNDTFTNGSVLEPASFTTPTSDSAGYDIASNQNATTSSIASGDLNLDSAKSSNAITEVQTVFTESPVSLSAVGSKIDLILTFKDTAGVMVSGSSTSAGIYFGLYDSGGNVSGYSAVAPENNLENAELVDTDTNDATGGVKGYLGYVSETFMTGSTNGGRVDTRPAQSASTNIVQDLVSDATSSSSSYTGGTTVGTKSTGSTLTLVAGDTYTEDLNIDLTAASTEAITGTLYSGTVANVGNAGDVLNTYTGSTATNSNFETSSFDALAMGYRNTDDVISGLAISQIEVISTPAVPEPATLSLVGGIALPLLARRWRRRRA